MAPTTFIYPIMHSIEKNIILKRFIGEVYFYPLTFTEQITNKVFISWY